MKNIRALIFLFLANSISGFAQGISMLAIPWYLVSGMAGENGNFLNIALVMFATLASLFWGLYAGTIVDRYNRKYIFMGINLVGLSMLTLVASLGAYLGRVPFSLIALIYTGTIFIYNVHYPNLYAFVQELFEPRFYSKVNSAIELQGQLTSFLGMMVGAVLVSGKPMFAWWPHFLTVETWELYEIFALDAVTYLIGFSLISMIRYTPSVHKKIDRGSVIERLRIGWEYLNAERPLLIFGIASYLIFFSLLMLIQVVMPIYVNSYLHADGAVLAMFKGFYAVGAVIAGLLGLSPLIRRSNLIRQIILLLIGTAALYFLFATTRSVSLTLGSAVLLGICNAGTRILRITYIVRIVPNRVIGRVNSFFSVTNVVMRLLFSMMLMLPFFSKPENGEHISYAFLILSALMLLGAVALFVNLSRFNQKEAIG